VIRIADSVSSVPLKRIPRFNRCSSSFEQVFLNTLTRLRIRCGSPSINRNIAAFKNE
jgi:hypothetical protein